MRLQNEKNSHIKGRDSMRNCIWLIRKSMKVCPQRLPAMLLVALLDGVNAVNIILFYKYNNTKMFYCQYNTEQNKAKLYKLFIRM